jgi:hypothetical protein
VGEGAIEERGVIEEEEGEGSTSLTLFFERNLRTVGFDVEGRREISSGAEE